ILENGWGKHAGIFAVSDAGFRAVLRHLRSFLVVNDEDGTPLRFRYYDPRVFSRYIATCNADDLATLFGPVKHFALESEDAAGILSYERVAGSVKCSEVPLSGPEVHGRQTRPAA